MKRKKTAKMMIKKRSVVVVPLGKPRVFPRMTSTLTVLYVFIMYERERFELCILLWFVSLKISSLEELITLLFPRFGKSNRRFRPGEV
jgi:hypothetical protein